MAEATKRMRVLLISNLFPNPEDRTRGIFTYEIVKEMRQFCDVTVVCPLPWFPRLSFLSGLKKWYPFALVPREYDFEGIRVHCPKYPLLPKVSERLHPFFMYLGLWPAVRRLQESGHFDAINAQWLYPDGVAASWIARKLKLPLVLTGLGCDINLFLTQSDKESQILRSIEQAEAVTVVSDKLKDFLALHQAGNGKVRVIPNGVDTGVFRPRDRRDCARALGVPFKENQRTIVFVGQLLEVKGVRYLIEAASKLRDSGSDFALYLVGEGGQRPEYEAQVRQAKLEDRVRFVGAVPHDTVATWMGLGEVFCLPSIREGCPNVVMEALASGRPVVASRVGGIPEMVNAANGILAEPESGQKLYEALDQALKKSWDAQAIHRSVAAMSWSKAAGDYFQALRDAAEGRREPI